MLKFDSVPLPTPKTASVNRPLPPPKVDQVPAVARGRIVGDPRRAEANVQIVDEPRLGEKKEEWNRVALGTPFLREFG